MTTTTTRNNTGNPPGVLWTRIAARGAAAVVAGVAGAASFEHIASVAIGAGERTWVGYSLPFAIDGLILVGVVALLEDQRHGRRGRLSGRLAVLVGVAATLAANVASAEPTWTARLVALTAPVSFLLSVEVLTRTGRQLSTADDTTSKPAPWGKAATRTRSKQSPPSRRRPNAAQRVVEAVTQTPNATPAEIAARLRVSERTVQRHWPKPAADTQPAPNGVQPAPTRSGVVPVPAAAFHRAGSHAAPDRTGAGT